MCMHTLMRECYVQAVELHCPLGAPFVLGVGLPHCFPLWNLGPDQEDLQKQA